MVHAESAARGAKKTRVGQVVVLLCGSPGFLPTFLARTDTGFTKAGAAALAATTISTAQALQVNRNVVCLEKQVVGSEVGATWLTGRPEI